MLFVQEDRVVIQKAEDTTKLIKLNKESFMITNARKNERKLGK